MSLPELLAAATHANGVMRAEIDERWLQGRTAYGGLSAALALAAAKQAVDELAPLRSAQIAFVGPLAGKVEATPTLLRRGKNSAFVSVDVTSEAGLGLRALFLFMTPRESTIAHDALPMAPVLFGGDEMPSDRMPGFLKNFHVQPWQRGAGSLHAWRKLRARDGIDPELELVAIADALPPAAMSLIDGWGPISTTTWQLNMIDGSANPDGWFLLEAIADQAADGASAQRMTIWNHDGRAVATATQSVALFV